MKSEKFLSDVIMMMVFIVSKCGRELIDGWCFESVWDQKY